MRRLQNKPLKRQSNTVTQYDEAVYVAAMKRFQIETRGMLPDSDEVKLIRNKIYEEMRLDKYMKERRAREQHQGQTIISDMAVTADFSSFYNLLIVVPEEPECYEVLAIMNYFGFPCEVEEDNAFGHSKKDMGFGKNCRYPCLVIDSSSESMPSTELSEKDSILPYLFNAGLIGNYKNHSPWEKSGLEFIED